MTLAWLCIRASFLAWFLIYGITSARADEVRSVPTSERNYHDIVGDALNEYDVGHFEEARTLFSKAHALAPSARTWRGLGMADFELRNYPASVDALEQALRDPVKPLEGKLRSETESLLSRARDFVATIELDISPKLANVDVSIDGTPFSLEALRNLRMAVGEHDLTVSATGYSTERRHLRVVGGQSQRLNVLLVKHVDDASKYASMPQPSEQRRPLYKNAWLWTGVAVVVVAAAAVGLSFGLKREAEAEPMRGDTVIGGGIVQTIRSSK